MISQELKQKTYKGCVQLIEQEIAEVKDVIKELRISSQNDTKSSAGDKHETSRAMVDLEIQKQEIRLRNLLDKMEAMSMIDPNIVLNKVQSGALVETNHQIFFISTSLGALKVNDNSVIVLSPEAPLAQNMLSLGIKGTFCFRDKQYTVLGVV